MDESEMDFSSPCTVPSAQHLTCMEDMESRSEKRRLSQARHRATLADLFDHLRQTVYPQSKKMPTKCQVLHKAKNYVLELEQILEHLLKVKVSFNADDRNPSSLEEVKQDYICLYQHLFSTSNSRKKKETGKKNLYNFDEVREPASWSFPEGGPLANKVRYTLQGDLMNENRSAVWYLIKEHGEPAAESVELDLNPSLSGSSLGLMEFEGYLSFYKKTVDLLIDNKIVSPEQITLPVVSKAIFYLWQDIATERNSFIFQQCNLRDTTFSPDLEFCCQVPVCVEDHMHTELQDSQEGNSSAESNSDEIFIEDAFDVASDILERGDSHAILNDSLHFSGLLSENPEGNCKLYRHIVNFIKTELCGTAASQCYNLQEAAHVDYETVMLSCTETFDDEDL